MGDYRTDCWTVVGEKTKEVRRTKYGRGAGGLTTAVLIPQNKRMVKE
jgi:hypothetical protein